MIVSKFEGSFKRNGATTASWLIHSNTQGLNFLGQTKKDEDLMQLWEADPK